MGNALNVQAWSTTAATNDGADSTIGTVANTSSPTSVDDWVRGVMAAIAKYADDTGGALVAGGSATALTVTTGQSLSSGHIANGLRLCVRTGSAATGAATIAVDGLTAVDIKANNGSAIASGDWASGAILDLVYSSAASAFIAENINRQIASIELGHASDTTIARSAAGVVTVEGNTLCRIKTGSYTGDGATSKGITGVGFTPKYVRIWRRSTTDTGSGQVWETTTDMIDDHASGAAHRLLDNATYANYNMVANAIIALGSDGFTVDDAGTDSGPNTNGTVYNYLCLG